MKKKHGPWQQTYSNKIIDMNNINMDEIDINDIAHALSMQCRFAGHIPKFYSVAEHSFWVSYNVPKEFALWGLMHDAAEAYITDIPTYVKECVPAVKTLEQYILTCIALRFLPYQGVIIPDEVKEADLCMLMTEKEQFYTEHVRDWEVDAEPYPRMRLLCWDAEVAEDMFLRRFRELTE